MSEQLGALYHWSPLDRRKRILRYGLLPLQKVTVTSGDEDFRQPYVCLSPTPSCAWSLSGGMCWTNHILEWDLWQVRLDPSDEVVIRPSWGTLIEEVQVRNRIPKFRIWHVGTRTR